jgi:ferritin-like metal-binding protein YciE
LLRHVVIQWNKIHASRLICYLPHGLWAGRHHITIGEHKMGLFSPDIETLEDLYLHHLRDIYYAEKQIVKSLPEMIEKAHSTSLSQAFEHHLEETCGHVERLERVFSMIGEKAKAVDCPAIDGILEEADEVASDVDDKAVLDAALAAAAQAVEHYEMTRYGTLIAWSKILGRHDCADILQQTLDEERAADRILTDLAESRLNEAA